MPEEPPKLEPDTPTNQIAEETNQPPLEVEQAPADVSSSENPGKLDKHKHHWRKFKTWYGTHKKWSIPATALTVLIVVGLIPWTRFQAVGLVYKKDFTLQLTDSTGNIPVSGATVTAGSISAITNGSGQATLRGVKVGKHSITINKKYYKTASSQALVPILRQKDIPKISLTATGRQVKINVTNLITKKSLANVSIQVGDANAKTDSTGSALLVLPANAVTQKGKLSLDGYNDSSVTIQVSNFSIKENDFKLTPSGKIYYISNQTGSLNLMKVNLDGTGAEVAVAGTGTEQTSGTSVLQSADGKYVAMVTKRTSSDSTPQLYVLSTADDKLLQADAGKANFQIYDWAGDTLVYTVVRQDLPTWQQGASKLKAYEAGSGNTILLDQSAGSDATANANENYATIMVTPNVVVFGKNWQGTGDYSSKQHSLQAIGVGGQNHQSLATYPSSEYINYSHHGADTLYVDNYSYTQGASKDNYSQYTVGGSLKTLDITSDQFYQGQYSYYFSPTGKQTFWSENRDGKNTLLIGDQSGGSGSTVASLSDYAAFGWYTSDYVLVTKGGSELYIMGTGGGTPIKVADYQATSSGYYYGGR